LSGADAAELQRWMAETLLLGGLGDDAPSAPSTDANIPAIRSRVGGDHTT
jgi:hypothetical protein